MFQYNDNELIYQIREHNDDDAYNCLMSKYKPLIISKINSFNISNHEKEEFFGEGLITLEKAIRKYDTNKNMTFNRFFNNLLQNRLIDMLRKKKRDEKIEIIESLDEYLIEQENKNDYFIHDEDINLLSDLEKLIYQKRYLENKKPLVIARELNCNVKKVYDTIYRIKNKTIKRELK